MNRLYLSGLPGPAAPPVGSTLRAGAVNGIAVAVLVVGLVGAVVLAQQLPEPRTVVPLWVWILAFLAAERWTLPIRIGRHGYAVGGADAVLAAGLALAAPQALLVARLLSVGALRWLVDRQRPTPLALNIGVAMTETVIALSIYDLLAPPDRLWAPGAALAVPAAVVAAAAAGAVIVLLALTSSDGVARPLDLGLIAAVTVSLAAGGAGLGALAVDLFLTRPELWWLVLPPAGVVILLLLGFVRQRTRVTALTHLLETTRSVHQTSDPDEAVRRLIAEVRSRFGGDIATLTRLSRDGGEGTTIVDATVGVHLPPQVQAAIPAPGEARFVDRPHPRTDGGTAMAATITVPDGSGVVLRVARVESGATPYRRVELEQFRELATAAVTSLETSRMSEMLARLRQIDEMKTAFLTAVSHDLRTPLAVVRAGIETLLVHAPRMTPEQHQMILARLQAQGRRLDQMLVDLLDIDRLQRGVLVPLREPTDVTDLANRVAGSVAAITHPVRVSEAPVRGLVDPGQVVRIIENLVRNAVKYTPAGTPIWIETRRDAMGVQLVVADAGPGVPDADKERIFAAFVRGDDAHPSPGTGVGLDLVRRLASLHGGRAWVDDRPGGGARFCVTLPDPVASERPGPAAAPADRDPGGVAVPTA